MKRITIDGKEFELVPVEADILPNYPTMDDIYDSVQPTFTVNDDVDIYNEYVIKGAVPTQEDAEHVAAVIQLINIATYYNAMFPDESIERFISYDNVNKIFCNAFVSNQYEHGFTKFTSSAAAEALKNHEVVEVLNKYFRIK